MSAAGLYVARTNLQSMQHQMYLQLPVKLQAVYIRCLLHFEFSPDKRVGVSYRRGCSLRRAKIVSTACAHAHILHGQRELKHMHVGRMHMQVKPRVACRLLYLHATSKYLISLPIRLGSRLVPCFSLVH